MYYDTRSAARPVGGDAVAALAAAAPLLPPGGFGSRETPTVSFYNVPPRSRAERKTTTDRDAVEKSRLRERKGAHYQYSDPGGLVAPDDTSTHFMGSKERFKLDAATEVRLDKEDKLRRKATELLRRREENVARDEERWQKMEAAASAAEARVAFLQADGGKAQRNRSGMPFDPVTLAYHSSREGEVLRYQDDATKFRAAYRTQTLQMKGRGVDYNVLTGESAPLVPLPAAPQPVAPLARAGSASSLTAGGRMTLGR